MPSSEGVNKGRAFIRVHLGLLWAFRQKGLSNKIACALYCHLRLGIFGFAGRSLPGD